MDPETTERYPAGQLISNSVEGSTVPNGGPEPSSYEQPLKIIENGSILNKSTRITLSESCEKQIEPVQPHDKRLYKSYVCLEKSVSCHLETRGHLKYV